VVSFTFSCFTLWRDYPAPIGRRAGGDADQVWKLQSKDKSLPQLGIKLLS